MKIVLAGGYDTSNLGDHGMLYSLRNSLLKIENSKITILSRHLESQIENDYGIEMIKNLDHNSKAESIGRWFNGFNFLDNQEHMHRITQELLSCDVLVFGGGRLFVDVCLDFMKGPLPYFVLLTIVAKFLGVPIAIFGMTIVPPKTEEGKEMLKFIIENSDLTMVRENSSKKTLDVLKIKSKNIEVIPDPAFSLPKINNSNLVRNIFNSESLNINDNYIGINLRYTNLEHEKISDEEYFVQLSEFCDALIEKYNKKILLISQMNYHTDNPFDDDRNVHSIVKEKSKYKDKIFILGNKYNVIETLAIYGKIDLLISMRRHGLIFASTQGTPVVALSAESNTSYAMHEMNLEKFIIKFSDLGGNVLEILNNLNLENTLQPIKSDKLQELSKKTKEYANLIYKLKNNTKNNTKN